MRHGKKIHKLGRPTEHRKALLINLASALITHKQIETTDTKAKALKPYIDKLIATASQGTLHAKRQVARTLPNKAAFKELFENVLPKIEGRNSGFSRIIKNRVRRGDGAAMSIIQLILDETPEKREKKTTKKKAAPKPAETKQKAEEKQATAEPEPEEAQASETAVAEETAVEETAAEETPQEEKLGAEAEAAEAPVAEEAAQEEEAPAEEKPEEEEDKKE